MIIAFDYDGTLTQTLDGMYAIATQYQHDTKTQLFSTKNELRDLVDLGIPGILKKYRNHPMQFKSLLMFKKYLQNNAEKIPQELVIPFAGIPELLETLTQTKYIVTSGVRSVVAQQLENLKLHQHFKQILALEDSRSKVVKLKTVCEQEQCTPKDIIFVTDTSSDVIEGKKAGVHTVAVMYGYGNQRNIEAAKPDHMITSPEELKLLLQKLTGSN